MQTSIRIRPSNDRPIVEPAGLIRFTVASPIRETAYLVQAWVPTGPAPVSGWPILYVLDGKAVFDLLAREFALDDLRTVIVGVSHDSAGVLDAPARAYDFTPPSPGADRPVGLPRDPEGVNPHPGGGAEAFLDVLLNRIEPALVERLAQQPVAIDAAQRSIYGHSYAGLFVLYAYLKRPQDFIHSFAASPSLWWNRQALMAELPGLERLAGVGGTLSLTIGDIEAGCAPYQSAAADFYRAMSRYIGRRASFEAFAGQDHGAMLSVSLARALTQWAVLPH
ncbi:MAG: alpha/beta hydrolase [Burkholderiaceae bacterium]|nr:alpha/beta hydrolase [Burkholderiaceae bacterium]